MARPTLAEGDQGRQVLEIRIKRRGSTICSAEMAMSK